MEFNQRQSAFEEATPTGEVISENILRVCKKLNNLLVVKKMGKLFVSLFCVFVLQQKNCTFVMFSPPKLYLSTHCTNQRISIFNRQ